MVGLLLFENTGKVQWGSTKEALPVFITAIFTAFTFSVMHGVAFGIAIYVVMLIGTGELYDTVLGALNTPLDCLDEEQVRSGQGVTMSSAVSFQVIDRLATDLNLHVDTDSWTDGTDEGGVGHTSLFCPLSSRGLRRSGSRSGNNTPNSTNEFTVLRGHGNGFGRSRSNSYNKSYVCIPSGSPHVRTPRTSTTTASNNINSNGIDNIPLTYQSLNNVDPGLESGTGTINNT